jgi:uncharacterized protein (TIGR03032 family)
MTATLDAPPAPSRTVRHEYTLNLAPLLRSLGASLLVSTYQGGKLVVVGPGYGPGDDLVLTCHNFERAMGIAVAPGRIAVGARSVVWLLNDAPTLAPRLEPAGTHDACYLTRAALYTGEILGHELEWISGELWAVNTLFSCLCTHDDAHSFVPRWRPPFVSRYAAEDRCHLNGLATDGNRPRFVTAFGTTDTRGGWRPGKLDGGCLIDVDSGEAPVRGLCMPHSPRLHDGAVWLCDSGTGRLVRADLESGTVETVAVLPGYTRGLALAGGFAFVGLSKARETATFGGVPIVDRAGPLTCGVAVVDLRTGQPVSLLEFHEGVDEVFDVRLVPGVLSPVVSGPHPEFDGQAPIWVAPTPAD